MKCYISRTYGVLGYDSDRQTQTGTVVNSATLLPDKPVF